MDLRTRAAATAAVIDRFRSKPFDWSKQATCIHLVRAQAAAMGHELPIVPRFRSALGALRALRSVGVETLPELLDRHFPRIPAASAIVGDVVAAPAPDGLHALLIHSGGTKYIGWHEDGTGLVPIELLAIEGAWRL